MILLADKLAVLRVHGDGGACGQLAGEDNARDERFHAALEVAAERSRAVQRVEAAVDDESLCGVGDLELERLVGQTLAQAADHDVDYAAEILARERTEHDRFVQTVEKLRTEGAAKLLHDRPLRLLGNAAVGGNTVKQILAAEVGGQDDDGVLEVHRASLRVGDTPVVEYLEQDVEHIRVRLFDLVEQHHAVGLAPHGLGELSALVVADVSGRRADETRHGEFLHVLGHVDTDDVVFVVKQALGQRLGKLRLAHARGAEEQERADGTVGVGNAGAGAEYGLGHALHGLVLTDHAAVEIFVKVQQLLALALHELGDGDTRPLGDDGGYLVLGHGVVDHGVGLALLAALLGLLELALKVGQDGVFEPCRSLVLIAQLGVFDVGMGLLDLGLESLDLVDAVLLALPAGLHLVEGLLLVGKLLAQSLETVAAELIVLAAQSHFLYFKLHDLAADVVQLSGHGVYLRADEGARLVHEVDGLVGEETVGYIPVGERRGGDESAVVDAHAVVDLVALLESAEDGYRVLNGRLVDGHGLETALERGVLFDVLAVLVERGRADTVQLAPCKHRLEEVTGVHAALGLARADDGVQLVDEEDYPALAAADLLKDGLETLLKLAAVLSARDERAHIEGKDGLVLQPLRHVAADDTLGETLGDGGLADARLADEDGVVLGLTREDTDDVPYLGISADDGVKLVFPRALYKVRAVFRERVVGAFRVVAGDWGGFDGGELRGKGGLRYVMLGKKLFYRGGRRGEDTEHDVFDGDVLVPAGGGRFFGRSKDSVRVVGEVYLKVS